MNEYILKRIVGHAVSDLTESVYTHRNILEMKAEIVASLSPYEIRWQTCYNLAENGLKSWLALDRGKIISIYKSLKKAIFKK